MQQLFPAAKRGATDPYALYRPDGAAPMLRLNMVVSADGEATDRTGASGGLGGAGDRELFRTLRALADAIVVGAGTVRVEGYGPHRLRRDLADRRRTDGRPAPAPIVVVSRTLDLDFASRLFTEAATPTVVVTCAAAPADRRRAAADVARLLVTGDEQVDLTEAVGRLRAEGLGHLLCEGGPRLNTGLLASGLVDEICLTVAPCLMAGDGPAIVGTLGTSVGLRLVSICEQDGDLLLRYRVRDTGPARAA